MKKKQILKKLNDMAIDDLNNNYRMIMSIACEYNGEHYGETENEIFVADIDNGIIIEDECYYFE